MIDINKYLENQLALQQKRSELKSKADPEVSEKSKNAANNLSKKQDKFISKKKHKDDRKSRSSTKSKNPTHDDDSDFAITDDDSDEIETVHIPKCIKSKQNVKKIVDDGNLNCYNERISIWRDNVDAAKSGKYDGIMSADIQYILDGNKDTDVNHELQSGLCIPMYIWKQLYRYQRIGVKWLWELHRTESGGLLGDEMGLGKTVQIIAFLVGLSKTNTGKWGGLGPSIIVAPATVIYQWVSHFQYWYPILRVAVLHNSGSFTGTHHKLIRDIHDAHGILLVTYAGIVKYHNDLIARKWHYIILDEGHKIRNPDTQISKMIKKFQTPHRLLITGSPMQNSLQELWSLFDFMRPGLLGTHNAFMDHFAVPITQGGYANATEIQEATALEIAKALKDMITPYMLRRTKLEVQEHINLPEKNEQVLFCALSQEQRDLYMGYLMSSTVRSILDKESRYGDPLRARILVALSTLRKICNHPDLYLYEAQEEHEQINEETFGFWKRSGKMSVVHSLLRIWHKQGHRALIFSQSRAMICIIEQYLIQQSFKYLRMDGSVSVGQRQGLIKTFNENSEYLVFLATTRVGGLGVNLTGADRVIIYDPDWNPATDSQAKERAWRIGQQRNVTVYRLISAGTVEEKIYQRQVFKHLLSNKVLVDPNQKNFISTSTLQGLFTLEDLNCDGDTETSSLFKHSKVELSKVKEKEDEIKKKKLQEMRKRAREISKKISQTTHEQKPSTSKLDDPRETYKRKRELLLNPPKVEEPEINLLDDQVTNVPFEAVLSELDIVNMHVKPNYEQNFVDKVLKAQETEEHCEETDNVNNSEVPLGNATSTELPVERKSRKRKLSQSESKKRKVTKKVKIKKCKKTQDEHKSQEEMKTNDDDYVLSKLFAKSTVKNALQHDSVVGLAEKERRYRMKEEATRKAREAIRAVKFSSK